MQRSPSKSSTDASGPLPARSVASQSESTNPGSSVFFILALLKRGGASDGAEAASELHAGGGEGLTAVDRAMHRYADGDDAAFGEVFASLAPRLRMFLRRLGCSVDTAEDLTQETFLRMHSARGSFARGKQVAPWAYAIARNGFISHARSGKAKLARASVDAEQIELSAGAGSSVEQETIARQSAEVVRRTLDAMTPARREAFVLLRYEGMSVAAAAQIVGISEGALKIRAFHAYELLRHALAGMEAEPRASGSNQLAVET
ncbi:MAG TPA: RNA polymerase sigma factor [Polyangiaceae bacterium]|nr:RNA polymerase sigma factor [Polyangiaceae bacterium]